MQGVVYCDSIIVLANRVTVFIHNAHTAAPTTTTSGVTKVTPTSTVKSITPGTVNLLPHSI